MKVAILNCFDTYEERVDLLHNFFIKKGHNVTVIQSDFRHFKKLHREDEKENFIFVKSKPYYKNLSVARLSSHYRYAKDAFEIADGIKADLLYVLVPPNSLAKFASKYKRKNKDVKLIFDLIDLWPETMPVGKIKSLPPFSFWRLMRDNNLKYADYIVTECELYQKILTSVFKGLRTKTIHLAKKEINVESKLALRGEEIHLCYLGSINNIIDIPKIKAIIKSINDIKPTILHVIGDGESKDILIEEVKDTGAKVEYHGKIYNAQHKQDIFDTCHFGLNIMKDTVCVGLTMKSIDYLQHGLPIINNIPADTNQIVEIHKIGINVTDENIKEVAYKIANTDLDEFNKMKKDTWKVFDNYFSVTAFEEKVNAMIKEI